MSRKAPITPSPHRFLAGKQRSPSPTKDARPGAGFRKEAIQNVVSPAKSTPTSLGSSQFATTPRFSFAKSKPTSREQRSPSPPKPAVVQSFRAHTRIADEVEDAADVDEYHEMLDDQHGAVLPTTERNIDDRHWTNDIAFSPKRRRLDDGSTMLSPTRTTFKHPGAPASELSRATPQSTSFQRQAARTPSLAHDAYLQRPAFIRPSAEPQEHNEPLPETFSPHKRGQKFVPGGMAASVEQWVIETGQAAVQSRKGQGYLKGEDYVIRAKIESVGGDGAYTAQATLANGDAIHILLAVNRSLSAAQVQEVNVGCLVGIRAPTWKMELDGSVWTIGVDWRVLS